MRRTAIALLVAITAAGCSGAAVSSPSSAASVAPSLGPLETGIEPTPSPALTPSPSGCPIAGAILNLDVYAEAEPGCFGSSEVSLVAWADAPSDPAAPDNSIEPAWLGTDVPTSSTLFAQRVGLPCDEGCDDTLLEVHVDPGSGLTFDTRGRWVVVTGHRHDARSASCAYAGEVGTRPAVDICRDHFVLTSVRDMRPVESLGFCATRPVLSTVELMHTDPACDGARDIRVLGYATSEATLDTTITPSWLEALADGANTLHQSSAIGADGDACTGLASPCGTVALHVKPGSGVTLPRTDGWIEVTGHFQDPASSTCRYADGSQTAADAIDFCRRQFVVTSATAASAPGPNSAVCPTASPIRLSEFIGTHEWCFDVSGTDARILVWIGNSEAFGVECPCVRPDWLWGAQPISVWQAQPTLTGDAEQVGCLEGCISTYAHVDPTSGLALQPGQWAVVTGHLNDPASQTCRWFGGDGAPPTTDAIRSCADSLVITAIEPASAPPFEPAAP